ncbi:hypothetical protein [Anaerosporobacter faecicola]|uniref:hypothetical protein n=1 Tax=Anaerosporobacter faecicola TaxID=2718714 RepID=UPI00143A00E4|nr:hypothetical protein [Anaerosporobacter faecicola]
MENYYEKINNLVQDLLIPARVEKKLNEEAFASLCEILEELEREYIGKDNIPRNIVGLLFFVYCSLECEMKIDDYRDKLFLAVGKMGNYLDNIFWDSPFK